MEKIVHHIFYGALQKHYRRSGFTAIITNDHPFGKECVHVRYSMCSKKDQFSRKKGREMAELSIDKEVLIKELPKFLQQLEDQCVCKDFDSSNYWVDNKYYKIALAFALDRE